MNHEDLFIWKDDFSKVWGNHDMKVGGLFSHNIKNEEIQGNNGLYFIQNSNSRTGNAISEILLKDLPITDYSEIDNKGLTPGRWHDTEGYFNDTWKFRPSVTLTLGMRYSVYQPAYAQNNHITNFVPAFYNGTDFHTGLVQAGDSRLPRSLVNTYHGGFQPRVGLAWDIFGNGKTALRLWRRALPFNEVLPSARLALVRAARDAQPTQPIIDANRRLRGLGPITMSQSTGDSDYHAMQVWVNRRFTQRLAFQAAYTWS